MVWNAEERKGRKPGGSFVKFAGSSDKEQGLMRTGCSPYRPLGICVVTRFSQQVLLNGSYLVIPLAALGGTMATMVSKWPDLGRGTFKASSWILPRFVYRVVVVGEAGVMAVEADHGSRGTLQLWQHREGKGEGM